MDRWKWKNLNCIWKELQLLRHLQQKYWLQVYFLTYVGLSLQVGHRPSATPRHETRTWAFRSVASYQLHFHITVPSPAVPRFSSLGEFTSELTGWCWLVLSTGCPLIRPHFLLKICSPRGCFPLRCQSSSMRIFSGHQMLKMRLRTQFVKVLSASTSQIYRGQLILRHHSVWHSLIRLLNDSIDLFRDTVLFQKFPQCVSVHAVKGLFTVKKGDVDR